MLGDGQMRNKFILRLAAICMTLIMAIAPVNAYAATILKVGSRGSEVKNVQTTLQSLGYFTYSNATGYYGSITAAAVKRFQKAKGITADGIIGKKTMGFLFPSVPSVSKSLAPIKLASVETSSVETPSSVPSGDLDWFSEVRDIWKRGMNAVVTDVDTGKSFEVKRTYGTNHADIETLTVKDTEIMRKIWGGFNWNRRAVVVQIGQYSLAGSMTAMPHAGLDNKSEGSYISGRSAGYGWGYNYDAVKNNGISGHMDIHFKNSRTHSTNVVQKIHQDMVKKATAYINNKNDIIKEAPKA